MADNLWDTTRTESAEHQPVGEGLLFAGYRAVLEGRPLDEARALAHMKGLVVLADIKSGTMAGFKSLAISGAERQWLLNPGLVHGEVRFVRYVTPQFYDFEMMHEVFLHEQAWVEVHVEEELDVDTIPLVLMHNQDVVHFNDREILVAHRDKNNRTLYRTAPLYIVPDDSPPGPRAGVQQYRVKAGDELLVAPAVNWFISPPTHRVQVWPEPRDDSSSERRNRNLAGGDRSREPDRQHEGADSQSIQHPAVHRAALPDRRNRQAGVYLCPRQRCTPPCFCCATNSSSRRWKGVRNYS